MMTTVMMTNIEGDDDDDADDDNHDVVTGDDDETRFMMISMYLDTPECNGRFNLDPPPPCVGHLRAMRRRPAFWI